MGLAIARGLVDAVGGSIAVADKTGNGTRFEFSVPLFKGDGEQDDRYV
jgi:signal transduction histidine kinase